MANKKFCQYCTCQYLNNSYGMNIFRGEYFYENSFEGYIRKMPNYFELVIELEGYNEQTVSIEYCPWCGRKLK